MNLRSSIFTAIALSVTSAAYAQNDTPSIGVMGLYNAEQPLQVALDANTVQALGCSVRLSGAIGGTQGDINLEQPNQFFLLACNASVLSDMSARANLVDLIPSAEMLAMFEGDLVNFPAPGPESPVAGRQYVFKISYYKNQDPDARDTELFNLTAEAEAMTDTYVTEAFIGVNHAIGLPTPDEVVVLYYDDPETGDRFRDANGSFLRKVGKFNDAYLLDTVYYIGQAVN